jgi:hypothetical protein
MATATEYGVIAAVISVGIIAGIELLGGKLLPVMETAESKQCAARLPNGTFREVAYVNNHWVHCRNGKYAGYYMPDPQ